MVGNEPVGEVFEWGEPPAGRKGGGRAHAPIAVVLKSKPGEWARVGDYDSARISSQMAYVIRTGRLAAYAPAGSFEAVGRLGEVWARYVGEPDA